MPNGAMRATGDAAGMRPLRCWWWTTAPTCARSSPACSARPFGSWRRRTALAALEQAREIVPDVIVSDLMMPRLDGLGLVAALRADAALDHVPVVMLTARAGEESRLSGLRSGVDDYLAKPFRPDELRLRVANLLARQQRLRVRFGRALAPTRADARASARADAQDLLRDATTASPVEVTAADEAFVARAKAAVEAEIGNEGFSVDDLADALGLSRRQLERKLRALVDVSPSAFVRLLRLSRAAHLLAEGFGNVSEVAYAVGLSPSHFARLFRDHYGTVPSEWTPPGPDDDASAKP